MCRPGSLIYISPHNKRRNKALSARPWNIRYVLVAFYLTFVIVEKLRKELMSVEQSGKKSLAIQFANKNLIILMTVQRSYENENSFL